LLCTNRMYDKINQFNILNVLDRLWIQYKKLTNNTYWIIQDWKLTDWYRINTNSNYVIDFSKGSRAQWPPFSFTKIFLNLTNQETYKRFETNFNIRSELKQPKNKWSPKQKKNKVTIPYSRNRLKNNQFNS